MAHQLNAELVFTKAGTFVRAGIPRGHEVIKPVGAPHVRKRHHALFGKGHILLELAECKVSPRRSPEVVQAHVGRFKSYGAGADINRGYKKEGDVVGQGTAGENVDACKIKPRSIDSLFTAWSGIHGSAPGALKMPVRRDSHCHRPKLRPQPDGSILLVPQLIALVLEFLTEAVQLGPSFMAGGARQPVFAGEYRYGERICRSEEEQKKDRRQQQTTCKTPLGRGHGVLLGRSHLRTAVQTRLLHRTEPSTTCCRVSRFNFLNRTHWTTTSWCRQLQKMNALHIVRADALN